MIDSRDQLSSGTAALLVDVATRSTSLKYFRYGRSPPLRVLLERDLDASDVLLTSRYVHLFPLPLELQEMIFLAVVESIFPQDSCLLSNVLLDRALIGRLPLKSFESLTGSTLIRVCELVRLGEF